MLIAEKAKLIVQEKNKYIHGNLIDECTPTEKLLGAGVYLTEIVDISIEHKKVDGLSELDLLVLTGKDFNCEAIILDSATEIAIESGGDFTVTTGFNHTWSVLKPHQNYLDLNRENVICPDCCGLGAFEDIEEECTFLQEKLKDMSKYHFTIHCETCYRFPNNLIAGISVNPYTTILPCDNGNLHVIAPRLTMYLTENFWSISDNKAGRLKFVNKMYERQGKPTISTLD